MDRKLEVELSLLIVHQGALGDFIVTFPVLKALRVAFHRIDGLCRLSFGRLAVDIGVLDHHYPLESARFASLYADRADSDVGRFVSSYSHILLFSFSSLLERSMRKIHADRVYRIAPWPDEADNVQATEFLSKQVLKCGILSPVDREKFNHAIFTSMGDRGKNIPPGATIVLSPGAGSIDKRWPIERFLAVAIELSSLGWRPVILLGPAEAEIEMALKQRSEPLPAVVRCESFSDLLTLLESAGGYIGNDSGVSHLAAFLGLPVLVIFGASDPVRWRPFGTNVWVVTPSVSSPEGSEGTRADSSGPAKLKRISAKQVLAALDSAFRPDVSAKGDCLGPINMR